MGEALTPFWMLNLDQEAKSIKTIFAHMLHVLGEEPEERMDLQSGRKEQLCDAPRAVQRAANAAV